MMLLRGLSGDAAYPQAAGKEAPEVSGEAARNVINRM